MIKIFSMPSLWHLYVFIFFITLSIFNASLYAGFPGDTVVVTPQGMVSLQSLKVGDTVISFDESLGFSAQLITDIQENVDEVIKVVIEDETAFYISQNNRIYAPALRKWIRAEELCCDDLLLTRNLTCVKVKSIFRCKEPVEIFTISVEGHHNFCITQHGIVVHNMNVLFEWVAQHGSTILATAQTALIQAGTAAVWYVSTQETHIDYTVPQLPGQLGDQFRLNGKDFIYTADGWKLQTELQPDQLHDLKNQAFEAQHTSARQHSVNDTSDDVVVEPEYTYVAREGWGNNGTWWAPVGTRLYSECCTIGSDGITILYYDFARDAHITQDLKAKREAQKQRAENKKPAFSAGASGGGNGNEDQEKKCWCGCGFRGSIGGCSCTCTCPCSKKDWNSNKCGYTYEHGIYAGASYHHMNSTGNSKGGKSPAPKDGQRVLDNSVEVGSEKSNRRVGIDSDGSFVVFDRTLKGTCPHSKSTYHGHTQTWKEIESGPSNIKNAFTKNGLANQNGKILKV